MMALHHRKILYAEPEKKPEFNNSKNFSSDCYMCYVCPENCYVSPPPPQLSPLNPGKNHVSTVLILMLCILGVAFLLLSYLTIARYRCRNSRRRNPESLENSRADFLDENQGPFLDHPIWYIRTVGFPQPVIDSITSFEFKKGDGLIEGNDCSVCLSQFQENERLRLLPKCSHAFHVACIDTWLRSHKNCPVCRAPILIDDRNNTRLSSNESSSSSSGSTGGNHGVETRPGVETGESRETRNATESRGAMSNQEGRLNDVLSKNGLVFDQRNGKFRVLSDLGDHHRVKLDQDQELQGVRRSISMDFSSASMIYRDKKGEGCSDTKMELIEKQNLDIVGKRDCKNSSIYRMIKSSSYTRSLQKGPVSMKRSFSFSGKRSIRKNSRSQESIQIPEISMQNQCR